MRLFQTNVPPPHVINTAGGSTNIAGGNYYGYNIGEPIMGTQKNSPFTNYYTQGFYNPIMPLAMPLMQAYLLLTRPVRALMMVLLWQHHTIIKAPFHLFIIPYFKFVIANPHNLMPGTYTFTIIDSINHPLIKVVTINASTETCPVSIHNAFSPNGDGLNETFFI